MPLNLERFSTLRPYLYHTTAAQNLRLIRSCGNLSSASTLTKGLNQGETLRKPRKRPTKLGGTYGVVWLQTQRPLQKGHIDLETSFTLEALVELLNSKLFFWPGTNNSPIPHGVRHRTGNEWPDGGTATICVPTQEVVTLAEFCRYNSGAPRTTYGKKSPRGPKTFVPASDFVGTASKVIEVVFGDNLVLPQSAEFQLNDDTQWKPLF